MESGLSVFAKPTREKPLKMENRLPLTDADGEVRELTEEDFKHFRPASEVLPELFGAKSAAEMLKPKKPGRPLSDSPKIATALRLDPDVLKRFKTSGKGWQTRMNKVLKDWLDEHPE
jgi:uncharacterized protein (DUF4415 family)